jgi:hypothetical protein
VVNHVFIVTRRLKLIGEKATIAAIPLVRNLNKLDELCPDPTLVGGAGPPEKCQREIHR